MSFNPYDYKDLLKSHGIMALGLVDNPGHFRTGGVCVAGKEGVSHIAPPADRVPFLISDLFEWLSSSSDHVLIKSSVFHYEFEFIHPFYDGNGRTGRIINILYLVANDLLDLPILYLSRYINHNKGEYYKLIQTIRDNAPDNEADWENWIVFMLKGVELTAKETVALINDIKNLMQDYKMKLRPLFGSKYNHELLNNLFRHPYTKIEYIMRDLDVSRLTATKYLEELVSANLVEKVKIWKSNYYINQKLVDLFINQADLYK